MNQDLNCHGYERETVTYDKNIEFFNPFNLKSLLKTLKNSNAKQTISIQETENTTFNHVTVIYKRDYLYSEGFSEYENVFNIFF